MKALGDRIQPGDVILSNHPQAGGSHLPDLTVITPVFYPGEKKPVFFVASRGHHADIGGITPGSMPPHSKSIFEEGAVFKSFYLVRGGVFQVDNWHWSYLYLLRGRTFYFDTRKFLAHLYLHFVKWFWCQHYYWCIVLIFKYASLLIQAGLISPFMKITPTVHWINYWFF